MTTIQAEPFRMYAAYGLTIESQIPLEEFPLANQERADVVVAYGKSNGWDRPIPERGEKIEITDGKARFWLGGAGGFLVEDGCRITAYPVSGASPQLLRLYVEGMLLAMLLDQRGMCVLHASVIEIDGSAIALMGHVGAGKSSLAGALYGRGHRVLSDDNAALLLNGGPPAVAAAYPYVKLFPAVAERLGFHNGSLRALHASQIKMAGAVSKTFHNRPSHLDRVYVLGRNHPPEMHRLSPLAATLELVRNAVPTRWRHPGDAAQLERCAIIARQVPVFTVRTFSDLDGLPEVARLLEQHHRG